MVRERSPVQVRPLARQKRQKKETTMAYSLHITFKAFEGSLLERASNMLHRLVENIEKKWKKNQHFLNVRSVSLPLKRKRWTVLRSPHIDKKSREQFEIRVYKKLFLMQTNHKNMMSLLLFLLKQSSFCGVQCRVKMQYTSSV